eukprot:COSAG05_NODE_10703_length_550_cov_2.603104_1_plen_162_part_01
MRAAAAAAPPAPAAWPAASAVVVIDKLVGTQQGHELLTVAKPQCQGLGHRRQLPNTMRLLRLLCVFLIGQVALPRFVVAQEMTGEEFCEGGLTFSRTDQTACRAQECCQWEANGGMCWSAVGDALCSPDTGPAGFSVGDEVIVGDVAYDERACITRVNSDGS